MSEMKLCADVNAGDQTFTEEIYLKKLRAERNQSRAIGGGNNVDFFLNAW